MTFNKNATPKHCSRCGKSLSKVGLLRGIQCQQCQRWFHKNCYMAETGFDAIVKEAVSRNCACCLSTPIKDASLMRTSHANTYARDFLANGFCVIPLSGGKAEQDQLAAEVAAWGDEVVTYFHALMKTYECQAEFNAATPSLESGYSNFRQRGPGRFEIIAEFITDKVVPLLANAKDVQDTLTYLLCNPLMEVEKKLMSSGCFLSLTGSETQNYHTDGPALSDVVDLFPYAVNVFVPLVAVDSRNGTEFIPGSHVVGEHKKVKSVRPSVALGNALLFDYRVVHRGLRNSRIDPRPCYYATYSQSWYKDIYNFSEARYKRQLDVNTGFLESRSERMTKKNKTEKVDE